MNLAKTISNQPDSFSLDRISCATYRSNTEEFQSVIESYGLCVLNEKVVPIEPEHRENWFDAIRAVSNDHQSRLVVVRAPPNLKFAYMSSNPINDQVIIRSPLRRACDSDTINELSDLLGITPRERQVLRLVAAGCEHKTISKTLGTSPSTVKSQLRSVFAKTGTNGMRDIIVFLSGISELRAA